MEKENPNTRLLRLITTFLEHLTDADYLLRLRVLKYCFSEWKCMVDTIIAVARKLCELSRDKSIFRGCLPILINLSFHFGEDEKQRWNERTFVLFLLHLRDIEPQMAFILMRLIEWVVEYPGFVAFFRRVEPKSNDYYESSQGQHIQVTGDFFNFLIRMNQTFKKRMQTPVYLQRSIFATRVTLRSLYAFRFLKIGSRERENLLVLSGIASKLIDRLLCEGPKRMHYIINRFRFPKKN